MSLPVLLFCEHPITPGVVDPDFAAEHEISIQLGFDMMFIHFDRLLERGARHATLRMQAAPQPRHVVYRGWMLTTSQYRDLYEVLAEKQYFLINTPEQYQICHELPKALPYIVDHTPRTIYKKMNETQDLEDLLAQAHVFGSAAVIIKDYVKSEKHHWDTACYVPDARDEKRLRETILRFIQLRGHLLNEGIVIREFIPLKTLTLHSKSGMPLTEEYRLFFLHQQLLDVIVYWEEGAYSAALPDTTLFENLATSIDNNFFTMDIARREDGNWVVIELGDGQVSGLPERRDTASFYKRLREGLRQRYPES